jgi:hypothetical protein
VGERREEERRRGRFRRAGQRERERASTRRWAGWGKLSYRSSINSRADHTIFYPLQSAERNDVGETQRREQEQEGVRRDRV